MISASAELPYLSPDDLPDRDAVIGFLVNQCSWSTAKAAETFDLTSRQVRRIAASKRGRTRAARSDHQLTRKETEAMLHEYGTYSCFTPEEREVALQWLSSITGEDAVATVVN